MYETKCNSCTQHRNRMTQRPSKNVKHAPALLFFKKKAQCVSSATRRLSVKNRTKDVSTRGSWDEILSSSLWQKHSEMCGNWTGLDSEWGVVRAILCAWGLTGRWTGRLETSEGRRLGGKAWLTTVLKYETTVLFKTICRTEENTAAHLNVGSCFKVVRGFILYAATAPPDLCLCMCVCWCEKGEQRASRATSEHQGQPQSWCPRWRTKQCCWLS